MAINDPYISKVPGDSIRSQDWNDLQVFARTDINTAQQGSEANGSAIVALQSGQAGALVSIAALEAHALVLDASVAEATTVAAGASTITSVEYRPAADSQTALGVDSSLDLGVVRFGLRINFEGLGEPSEAALRRACRVEIDVPIPLGGATVAEAEVPYALQTVVLDGVTAKVGDDLIWEPRPAALYALCERLFAAVAKNQRSPLLPARLILEGDFVGAQTSAVGRRGVSFADEGILGGGRLELPLWLSVPYDAELDNQVPPADWPWAYGADFGDFEGAFAGIA